MTYIGSPNTRHRFIYIYIYAIYRCIVQLKMTYIRRESPWLRYIWIPLISVYCSWWWLRHRCIYTPLISAYFSWWWFTLKVETLHIGIYTIGQCVLQVMMTYIRCRKTKHGYIYTTYQTVLQLTMTYIRSWNARHIYILIPLISA